MLPSSEEVETALSAVPTRAILHRPACGRSNWILDWLLGNCSRVSATLPSHAFREGLPTIHEVRILSWCCLDSCSAPRYTLRLSAQILGARSMVRPKRVPPMCTASFEQGGHQQTEKVGSKYLSIECSTYVSEALIRSKDYTNARQRLELDLAQSEKLGLRMQTARIHYLLGT